MKISRNSQEEANIHIKGKKLEEVNQYKYILAAYWIVRKYKRCQSKNWHGQTGIPQKMQIQYSARTLIYL